MVGGKGSDDRERSPIKGRNWNQVRGGRGEKQAEQASKMRWSRFCGCGCVVVVVVVVMAAAVVVVIVVVVVVVVVDGGE